ncbi:choice-of-anchor G family protein [Microbacterium sp. NPDC091313]
MSRLQPPALRRLGLVSLTAVGALVVPLGVTATTASWNDTEWVHSPGVGTNTIDCGTTTGFAASAEGDFLSGRLLGTNLDAVAALAAQELDIDGNGDVTVSPPTSIDRGSTPPTYTYTNPLNISALGGLAVIDLTGLQVGLPVGSAGAVNQYAQVSGFGTAAGAAGLVNNTGGVLVDENTPDDQLPEPATISLASILPVVTGVVANPELEVGAVGSSSVLDGCAALLSQQWGDGSVTGITRDYGIASLDLTVQSALLGAIVTDTNTAVTAINAAVSGLLGPSGGLATAVRSQLQLGVGSIAGITLGATSVTGSISGLNLTGALGSLLTQPLTDGIVTVNLGGGGIEVDLAALLNGTNGLNNLAPNTQLLLNAAVVDAIVDRIGDLVDTRTDQIVEALRVAVRAATVNVNISTALSLQVLGAPVNIGSVGVALNTTLGALADGTATITPTLTLLTGLPTAVQLVLAPITALLESTVEDLATELVTPLANAVTNSALSLVTTLGTRLADILTDVVDALAVVLAPLPNVLSVAVNVQPDQPGALPGTGFIAGTEDSTPQYKVTALRLGVLDAIGSLAYVELGTASAGPVTVP